MDRAGTASVLPVLFPTGFRPVCSVGAGRRDREVVVAVNPDCANNHGAEGGERGGDGNDNVFGQSFSPIASIIYHGSRRLHGVWMSINRDCIVPRGHVPLRQASHSGTEPMRSIRKSMKARIDLVARAQGDVPMFGKWSGRAA
jgi:hypothetical protein